jgi:O-antigen/teichoic acid export membrane protein/GT2 family glycosyltransferase
MNLAPRAAAARLWGGTAQVFLAEALVLPTGLLTTVFLARRLGPEGYGLLVLAATAIGWLEWSLTSVFARTVVKFVSEAADWRLVAATALRLHLAAGLALALAVWVLAAPAAALLGEPALAGYLRLFALDLPLFGLAHAHRHVLVGLGAFGPRAAATASRWVARLLVVVLLVELGFSVPGAILGSLAGSLAELALARRGLQAPRPPLLGGAGYPLRPLWAYALPLAGMALSLRLFDKLDLFMLKALQASAAEAGRYGAALSLAWLPGLFALSFSPLLLANLNRLRSAGDEAGARQLARQAMRAVLLILPLAALAAGSAPGLLALAFGPAFVAASVPLAPLLVGAVALAMVSVTTVLLTAAGRPGLTVTLTLPLPPLALIGHWLVIPRAGPLGAALVTASLAVASAGVSLFIVHRLWRVWPPAATALRCVVLSAVAFVTGVLWPVSGLLLVFKLAMLTVTLLAVLSLLGEFSLADLDHFFRRIRAAFSPPAVGPSQSEHPAAPQPSPSTITLSTSTPPNPHAPALLTSATGPRPIFSVIVPTHGRPAALARCLAALAAQAHPRGRYEVIVVDDGSPASDARSIAVACADHGVRLFVQPHAGPGRARNFGAAHAHGQYLAFTDDDCCPEPGWLAALAGALAANPGAAVGGRTLNQLTRNPYAAASQALVSFLYAHYNHNPHCAVLLTSNNLAVPAETFHALGGFDETVPFAAAEDREWGDRWRFHGRSLIYSPSAVVHHAHLLGPRDFVWQHFRYGRGAYLCRQARQRRGQAPVPVEPAAFYLNLARTVARAMPHGRGWLGFGLAFVSQSAHALGFLWQQRHHAAKQARAARAVRLTN